MPSWIIKIWSGVWGSVSGLVGAGGPILVSLVSTFHLQKNALVATMQALFFFSTLVKIPGYLTIENSITDIRFLFVMVVIGIVGTRIGKWLHDRVPEQLFQKVVLGLLALSAMKMLWP